MEQDELKRKYSQDITTLKQEIDHLVIEKVQLFSRIHEFEEAIAKAYQHIHEITADLDFITKSKRLGQVIVQLQLENILLNAMVYPEIPPEKVTERKSSIEQIKAQFDEKEQDTKKVTEEMT